MKGFYGVSRSVSIPSEEDLRSSPRQTNDIDKYIATQIRNIRNGAGLSQSKVADMLDITFQQVQKYENCTNRISSSRLWDFAKIFKISISEFFPSFNNSYGSAAESTMSTNNIPYDKEIFALVKEFSNIKNPEFKKQITSMVKSFSKLDKKTNQDG